METIDVGCAIIYKNDRLLIAQRCLEDSFGGYWEFPGGKREDGESLEECLVREVLEELDVQIRPEKPWGCREHEIKDRKIRLFFHFCEWEKGDPVAKECKGFQWVSREDVRQYSFIPGDMEILEDLISHWDEYFKPGIL